MDESVSRAWQAFANDAKWKHLSPTDLERFGEFVRLVVEAGGNRPDFRTLVPPSVAAADGGDVSVVERLEGLYDVTASFWIGRRERP